MLTAAGARAERQREQRKGPEMRLCVQNMRSAVCHAEIVRHAN